MLLTKHTSNDPRGDPNPMEPEIIHNQRWFKIVDIQKIWAPEFKEQNIITGCNFEKNFPSKFTNQMLAPMNALGWTNFRPLPKLVYPKLVRSFYCNLEVGLLDNLEYPIDSRVRSKNIVLNPIILFEITGIPNEEECIFISKTSHLNKYIAYNIIPKTGHYNQVTNMDTFIIYKAAMEEPLTLNYIILKEMANILNQVKAKQKDSPKTQLRKEKILSLVRNKERKKGNEDTHDMEVDLTIIPLKRVQGEPNAQEQEQNEGSNEEQIDANIHEGINVDTEHPSYGKYLTQEGPPLKEDHQHATSLPSTILQLDEVEAQLEGLWVHLVPPPFALGKAPPRPPYRHPPY
ncbi:hypothetical protein Acr_17g0008310 [Actinidia rufa]|uniref:Uncharacterized protein n=1 Tax=Actinidia rufa TaxID=165716 RepID=A0A7J0G3A9_9ERIC|nr:hypothetical protein Acr_17g0008310 [Actinidia rufa]